MLTVHNFLTDSEKAQLKSFVNTPFVNYNKSTEILATHWKNVYHFQKIFLFNSEILPVLVEGVLTCARQKVALQGHKQDKIDFSKTLS